MFSIEIKKKKKKKIEMGRNCECNVETNNMLQRFVGGYFLMFSSIFRLSYNLPTQFVTKYFSKSFLCLLIIQHALKWSPSLKQWKTDESDLEHPVVQIRKYNVPNLILTAILKIPSCDQPHVTRRFHLGLLNYSRIFLFRGRFLFRLREDALFKWSHF